MAWRWKTSAAVAIAVVLVGVAGAAVAIDAGYHPRVLHDAAPAGDPERGRYLATLGDCMACHTAEGGRDYAGGLAIKAPFGTIYATNITPSVRDGIGRYTVGQFADAVRNGVRRDGRYLYPAMPYPSYGVMSDQDVRDLYAYFMHDVAPVDQPAPATTLMFPFSQRWGMGLWDRAFVRTAQAPRPGPTGPSVERGAYLVEGLGHCGSCHTPRAFTMQEKAMDAAQGASYVTGSVLDGAPVPSLRAADAPAGIGAWSVHDIADYLQAGRNRQTAVAGDMKAVVYHSTSHMTGDDLTSIAMYLKTLPAASGAGGSRGPGQSTTERTLDAAQNLSPGALLYLNNCDACHFSNGRGAPGVFPALAGNAVVTAPSAKEVISVILAGSAMPSTPLRPERITMPPFGWRLNDAQVAELATFVRTGWGNDGSKVTADEVRKVRAGLPRPVSEIPPDKRRIGAP